MRRLLSLVLLSCATLRADGPQGNLPDKVRPIPPRGITLKQEVEAALRKGLAKLAQEIQNLRKALHPPQSELLPDVEVFSKAVHDALVHQEFYRPEEVTAARTMLDEALGRAAGLLKDHAAWAARRGFFVVRGYRSRIDGSVQPYALWVPPSWSRVGNHRHRLDVWCHGRGEKLSEVAFIDQQRRAAR